MENPCGRVFDPFVPSRADGKTVSDMRSTRPPNSDQLGAALL